MHIDENKKFDKRNIEKNIRSGIINQKDYETYLSKLPDISDKLFSLGENLIDLEDMHGSKKEGEIGLRKKGIRKKKKGKR
jgi:hypothetical protein